jgi:transcriptional/translational regulatory protein YebC/TACO1
VKDAMEQGGLKPELSAVTMRAENDLAVTGETAEQVVKMLDMLEDLDDVQDVYSNADLGAEAYQ